MGAHPSPRARAGRVIRTFELELENATPASPLTPMRVQADSSPVRSARADSLLSHTRMQSAPLPRTGAAMEQEPGPIVWDPIFPAPRPSPRTRIVCVPGPDLESPKEEHDRASETEYLERVTPLLELSMERLVGSCTDFQRRYAALQKKNNMDIDALQRQYDALQKKNNMDIANKDSEIEKLQKEILLLKDR
jgi:hypothetical protein